MFSPVIKGYAGTGTCPNKGNVISGGLMQRHISISKIKQKLLPILQDYEVKRAAFFGSCARGEMREDSDIDILVDVGADISLLGFVGLKQRIEDALGRKVDLVEYDTLKPLLREKILKEQVVFL